MKTIVVGALLCALMSCVSTCRSKDDGDPLDSAVSDTGEDAGVPDSTRRDTSPPEDARVEVIDSTFDVASEAGEDPPYLGSWSAIPGAPTECGAALSDEPAKAVPPLKWISCPSGRLGCRILEVDWPTRPGPPFSIPNRAVFVTGGVTHLLQVRLLAKIPDDHKDRGLYAVGPLDGAATLALRTDTSQPTHCYFGVSIGAYGFGAWGGTSPSDAHLAVSAPWPTLVAKAVPTDTAMLGTPSSKGVQRTTTGPADLFLEAYSPDGIAVFNFATGIISPRKAQAEYPVGVIGGAVGVNFAASALTLIRPDSSWTSLTLPEATRTITWVDADHANGDALVWMESAIDSSTGSYASPTIWTSPYSSDPSAIVRRKVAVLADTTGSGGSGMVANAGMALTQTSDTAATLTRLTDGAGWSITAEPGQVVVGAVWVDNDEVIVGVKPATRPGPAISMQRLRRDTLGLPTIASGL